MVPLETTHTALATPALLSRMFHGTSSPFKKLVELLLTYFANTVRSARSGCGMQAGTTPCPCIKHRFPI
jgi:inosine-uridine nucleoside N-ribohydrolase